LLCLRPATTIAIKANAQQHKRPTRPSAGLSVRSPAAKGRIGAFPALHRRKYFPRGRAPAARRHNLPAGGFFDVRGVKIPVAVSAFAEEIYQAPKSWAEKAYPKLIHYNRFSKGTHFAAWEQPKLFVDEMRAAFKSLR
jgi:pimeloyl-ACP methyl ester carboxylesterase